MSMLELPDDLPEAWRDLLSGLALLARGQSNAISPLRCEHDTLWVSASAEAFTPEEIGQLEGLGFFVDEDGGFQSFRFGSA
jgi:hypothetical protein